MRQRERKQPRHTIIFLTSLLAVPTVSSIIDGAPDMNNLDAMLPYLLVGGVLGVAQLILRPLLRLVSASLGCLTLGTIGTVLDVALVYLAGYLAASYKQPSLVCALATAIVINFISALFAGRK